MFDQAPALFDQAPALFDQAPALFNQAPALLDQAPAGFIQAPALFDRPAAVSEQPPAFFELDAHRQAVHQHLATGTLPLKFAYAGSAALTHDRLAWSQGYQSVIGTVCQEADFIEELDRHRGVPRRIAEIGPGNGEHTISLLGTLDRRGFHCDQYSAFDFSRTLLELAGAGIRRSLDPRIDFRTDFWDIEAGPSAALERTRIDGSSRLVCLLGNTIGNLEDPAAAVRAVHDSARPGDVLLIGATLGGEQADDEVLAPYRTEVFRRAALEPLRCAGIQLDDVDFRVHYRSGGVTGHAILRRATHIAGQAVPARHIVRCFTSRRFRPAQVLELFDPAGWDTPHSWQPDAEHLLVAASVKGTRP